MHNTKLLKQEIKFYTFNEMYEILEKENYKIDYKHFGINFNERLIISNVLYSNFKIIPNPYTLLVDTTSFDKNRIRIIDYFLNNISERMAKGNKPITIYKDIFKVELHNIFVLINKTIALCCELSNLDKNSNQFIRFALTNFSYTIEELYKLQKIDETIIDKNIYELFYKLISIHTNNENSLKDDTLKKLFAKELSTQLNQDIQEEDLSNIQFEVVEIINKKQGVFNVTIKNKSYGRFSNIWIETISQ